MRSCVSRRVKETRVEVVKNRNTVVTSTPSLYAAPLTHCRPGAAAMSKQARKLVGAHATHLCRRRAKLRSVVQVVDFLRVSHQGMPCERGESARRGRQCGAQAARTGAVERVDERVQHEGVEAQHVLQQQPQPQGARAAVVAAARRGGSVHVTHRRRSGRRRLTCAA